MPTYCCEDGEGEEAGLDVIPVEGEILGDQVNSGTNGLTAHLISKWDQNHRLKNKKYLLILGQEPVNHVDILCRIPV